MPSIDVQLHCQLVVPILWEATSRRRVRFFHLVAMRGALTARVKSFSTLGVHISVLVWVRLWRGQIAGRLMAVLGRGWMMSRFFSRELSDCAVASFAVRLETWIDSSDIVFVGSATDVLSYCVAVARFASARVWSYCISVKSAALDCAAFTFAA